MAGSWSNDASNLIVLVEDISGYSGIFGYSPAPGAGNLVFSLAAAAGTDPYGNTYPNGLQVIDPATGHYINLVGGSVHIGNTNDTTVPGTLGYGHVNGFPATTINALQTSTYPLESFLGLLPGNGDVEGAAPFAVISESTGTVPVYGAISGAWVKTTEAAIAQLWQTPTYNTSWAASTTFNTTTNWHALQYRIDVEDNLWLVGCFKATGAAGQTVFTLPTGYRPAAQWPLYCQQNNAGTVSVIAMEVGSSGNVNLLGHNGAVIASGNEYLVNAKIPLGNIQ